MKVLFVEPGKLPVPAIIDGSLTSMQELVGGSIETVYPFEEPVALVCHEEGKLLHLLPNRRLCHPETGEVYDVVFGSFFLCSAPPDSENFESLSAKQIAHYTEYFKYLEFFPGIFLAQEVQ